MRRNSLILVAALNCEESRAARVCKARKKYTYNHLCFPPMFISSDSAFILLIGSGKSLYFTFFLLPLVGYPIFAPNFFLSLIILLLLAPLDDLSV